MGINTQLCGAPTEIDDGRATAELTTTKEMAVDEQGLVHGGFVFGLADHAAMLAVNDPNVVLGSAETKFTAPVRVGETVTASAKVLETKGKKRVIEVDARVDDRQVLTGTMTAFVLDAHVLSS